MRPTMIVIAPACSRAPMEARHGTDQIATAAHFLTRLLRWRSTQSIGPLSTFLRAHSALTLAEFTKALTAAKFGTELERRYRVAVFRRWYWIQSTPMSFTRGPMTTVVFQQRMAYSRASMAAQLGARSTTV